LPKTPWAKWVKSFGRQNGFDLKAKCPCRQNGCLTAAISLRYHRHFDAAMADLRGPGPQHIVCNKGVVLALIAKLAGGAMAGDEGYIIPPWPKLRRDCIDEVGMIAAREIGATDRALKQHIPDNRQPAGLVMENDMSGRMAGAMNDIER
jgi:hypothetical protein